MIRDRRRVDGPAPSAGTGVRLSVETFALVRKSRLCGLMVLGSFAPMQRQSLVTNVFQIADHIDSLSGKMLNGLGVPSASLW
jgi:hypothetical protein